MIMEGQEAARQTAERLARESYGRLLAFLAARTHDLAAVEDALSDAFAAALRQWPIEGVPTNPAAWLLAVARRRAMDAYRRRRAAADREEAYEALRDTTAGDGCPEEGIPDRRLALMFACAHPAVERHARTGLILQTVLGLTAEEIGPAFLVPPATMGQRLARAKARIKAMGIPFQVPDGPELKSRLEAVLEAVYSVYTKGWIEDGGLATPALVDEAIWLGRVLVAALPDEPEAKGMLALMLYSEARRAARRDAAGAYVPLENQTTALWDLGMIDAAEELLASANVAGPSGRYQIEAAIQSAHIARRIMGISNWKDVVALYDLLHRLSPSPVVALNRAVARANLVGAEAALEEIRPLSNDSRLLDYQPYWAALGYLYAGAGHRDLAFQALTVAMGLSTDAAIRAFLQHGRSALGSGSPD
jgi:RNA polymerase sigma-70 factor (ECF subfamily)